MKPVALIDMDGTLCDYDGAIARMAATLRSPEEPQCQYERDCEPAYISNRIELIKSLPGFWRDLEVLPNSLALAKWLESSGFEIHILTQGPRRHPRAWQEKVEWINTHLPDRDITITRNKSLTYGRILVDDYPPYMEGWLQHRPRGLGLMPEQPWNQDFSHPQVIKFNPRTEGTGCILPAGTSRTINRVYERAEGESWL